MSLEALIATGYNQPRALAILSCKYRDPSGMIRHYRGEGYPLVLDNPSNIYDTLELEMFDFLEAKQARIVADSIKFEYAEAQSAATREL